MTDAARVAIATAAEFPDLDNDGPVLLAALKQRGIAGEPAVWTDPRIDWATYDLVVVRSTWDYAPRRDEFLDWAHAVEKVTRLFNPADVLAWNTDKRYLAGLADAGVPVVPTAWAASRDELPAALDRWDDVVVKPTVSAGARDTARFRPGERDAAGGLAGQILASGRSVMVQPYLAHLDADGETGLVYLDGAFSHAFRKGALLAGAALGPGLYAEEEIEPRVPTAAQRAVADAVLAATTDRTGGAPLYARVDLVPGPDDAPVLIELELTEPSLFLATDDGAAARVAAVIAARVG